MSNFGFKRNRGSLSVLFTAVLIAFVLAGAAFAAKAPVLRKIGRAHV